MVTAASPRETTVKKDKNKTLKRKTPLLALNFLVLKNLFDTINPFDADLSAKAPEEFFQDQFVVTILKDFLPFFTFFLQV